MRPTVAFSVGVLAISSLVVLDAGPALADTCSYDPATHTVSISYSGEFRAEGDNEVKIAGGQITLEGTPCSDATVTNTDTIIATGGSEDTSFLVDIGGGPFAPGFTDEGDGTSEIEIHVNAGGGLDLVGADGGPLSDFLVVGSEGFNLNVDLDADVFVSGTEIVGLFGFGGDDELTSRGSYATGTDVEARLFGYGGKDTLLGGRGEDILGGGAGRDELEAGPGRDRVLGHSGHDNLYGQAGNDTLSGHGGNDRLVGGVGIDTCRQGPGKGRIRSCEKPVSVTSGRSGSDVSVFDGSR